MDSIEEEQSSLANSKSSSSKNSSRGEGNKRKVQGLRGSMARLSRAGNDPTNTSTTSIEPVKSGLEEGSVV